MIEKCLNKDLGTNSKVLHVPTDLSTRKSGIRTYYLYFFEKEIDVTVAYELGSIPNYTIRVKTGNQTVAHSATDIDTAVSIVLIDSLNDSSRILLEQTNNSARIIFQPGQEDRFDIKITPMSEVTKYEEIFFLNNF